MFLIPASSLQLVWSPTDWTSCAPSYIIIWRPHFFLRASQFCTQFNPSMVKVISCYSSTGCNCYLHRYISYFDSLAGVNMLQKKRVKKREEMDHHLKMIPLQQCEWQAIFNTAVNLQNDECLDLLIPSNWVCERWTLQKVFFLTSTP